MPARVGVVQTVQEPFGFCIPLSAAWLKSFPHLKKCLKGFTKLHVNAVLSPLSLSLALASLPQVVSLLLSLIPLGLVAG